MAIKKRAFPRTEYNRKGLCETGQGADVFETEIINLSPAGACIKSERDLTPGTVVRLMLTIKDTFIQYPCLAEVKWASLGTGCTAGLEFLI